MPPAVKNAKPAKAPAPEKVVLGFAEKLRLIDRAGYGVILTRTREPVRVLDALKQYAFVRKNPETNELDSFYRVWDCVRGWVEYPVKVNYDQGQVSLEEGEPSIFSDETDITAALGLIQDVKGLGKTAWKTGIYVFNYPHFHIKDNADFIVTLKSYCHSLPTGRSRVILIVPQGFTMPAELEDDITILDYTVPTQRELTARFSGLFDELGKTHPYTPQDVDAITAAGLGMTELDFDQAVSLAIAENSQDDPNAHLTASIDSFLQVIYRCKTEAVKRTNILQLVDPLPMSEIGGMENVKAWCMARRNWLSPAAKAFGLRAPRGCLVVGVPGSGKSLIPRGIAWAFKLPCVRLDIGKIFNKYVGESEARMDMVLDFIAAIAPVVVWVDEVDKAGMATGGANESTDRVKSKLLTFMQESKDGIFWVPTANRTDSIPTELVRPGRIDITFGVIWPTPLERRSVFEIQLRQRLHSIDDIADMEAAITASEGYTGAEIEGATNNAIGESFNLGVSVTGALLAKHIKFIKPQKVSHADDMQKIATWCNNNSIPASAEAAEQENRAASTPSLPKKVVRKIGG